MKEKKEETKLSNVQENKDDFSNEWWNELDNIIEEIKQKSSKKEPIKNIVMWNNTGGISGKNNDK